MAGGRSNEQRGKLRRRADATTEEGDYSRKKESKNRVAVVIIDEDVLCFEMSSHG